MTNNIYIYNIYMLNVILHIYIYIRITFICFIYIYIYIKTYKCYSSYILAPPTVQREIHLHPGQTQEVAVSLDNTVEITIMPLEMA